MFRKKIYIHDLLYEVYPFFYFFIGTSLYLLLPDTDFFRTALLSVFFGAGFLALLIRQKNRRFLKKKVSQNDKTIWLPKLAYETIPVFYMVAGITLLLKSDDIAVFVMSLALFSMGLYYTISRVMHRFFLK
jgi:hypothetical protein